MTIWELAAFFVGAPLGAFLYAILFQQAGW
jgi:hypothetical protein